MKNTEITVNDVFDLMDDSMLPALIAELIPAMIQVESGGIDYAKGDLLDGEYRAIGCLQLWKIYVRDCNRIVGYNRWNYADRLSRKESIDMTEVYLDNYGNASRLKPTSKRDWLLKLAKNHHLGATKWKNDDEEHINKIIKELDK